MQKSIIVETDVTELNKAFEEGYKVISSFPLYTGCLLLILERN